MKESNKRIDSNPQHGDLETRTDHRHSSNHKQSHKKGVSAVKVKMLKKEIKVLKRAFSATGAPCYTLNISKNIVPGNMYHIIDGKEENINELLGFPANVKIDEVTAYFAQRLPENERLGYLNFFDASRLLRSYHQGETHVVHTYWSGKATYVPLLIQRHVMMYRDEHSGDVMGLSYSIDLTNQFNAEKYKNKMEKEQKHLKVILSSAKQAHQEQTEQIKTMADELKESMTRLDEERQFLNVLCRDYIAVHHVNLDTDVAMPLKQEEASRLDQADILAVRQEFCYSQYIKNYCDKYVISSSQNKFMYVTDRYYLRAKLRNSSRYVYRYRSNPNLADNECFEIQAIRINDDPADGNVLIAFRHIDDVIDLEQRHQLELEELLAHERYQNELLTGLSQIFYSIFRIDLQEDTYEELYRPDGVQPLMNLVGTASTELQDLCRRFVVPEHRDEMLRFFNLSTLPWRLRQETTVSAECKVMDGNWHQARFIVKRRDETGAVIHVLYTTRIISDQKRREERLISVAEDANDANKAKTDFISQVAHDIRTPLNSMFGFLEIAEANLNQKEKVEYCLKKMRVAGSFLNDLVNDVLDISRIENGVFKIQPVEVSLTSMMEEFTVAMENTKFGKQQDINFEIGDMLWDRVMVDPLRLKQIYTNVLTNAIKYTPDGGRIDFSVYQEELPGSDCVRLVAVIADTGIGMSQEFMANMFTKFERATDTRINKVNGYGLGLSIVKQLVDLMHGDIAVQSKEGEGTTFWITLDMPYVATASVPIENCDVDHAAQCVGLHLLVAEDSELNREVITELLAMYQITCDCAEDGIQCLKLFTESKEETYDAILMDMQMPNMNGLETAQAIRALPDPHASTIPIIAMTANALKDDVDRCLAVGMNRHLSKPVNMKKLLQTLVELK